MTKLQQIKFTSHPAFEKDSTLTLFDGLGDVKNIPSFIFLAGENGSGKTSILDLVFNSLGKTKKGYLVSVEDSELDAELTLMEDKESVEVKITIEDGRIKANQDTEQFKVIYNKVDVSFKKTKITSVTPTTVDEKENPREESENLSQVIPQLLANVKTQDATYFDDYFQEHGVIPAGHTRKLDRFTNAFEKMFDGTKTFKTIKPQDGEIKIIFTDMDDNEVGLDTFSTGEKQIIYRVGSLLKDLGNLDGALVLIDEPETSLHPKWQRKYVQFLTDVFDGLDIQFIIATHSPYILQGLKNSNSICYKIDRNKKQVEEEVGFYKNMIGGGPSLNLINYKVYDIADELLHIELFAALEIKEGGYNELRKKLEANTGIKKAKSFLATINFAVFKVGDSVSESLPISIRNKIHHADEIARPDF